ncbi:unnamed protein product [Prunus brigantina]
MASTDSSSSSSTSTMPSLPNSSHFIKLIDSNYLLWLRQIKSSLVGHDLWRFVDGTHPQPSATITLPITDTKTTTTATLIQPNLAHALWYKQDQLLISYLTSTLSEPILHPTIGCDTTRDIWDCLQRHFSQSSQANETILRFQLMDMQKGSQTIDPIHKSKP